MLNHINETLLNAGKNIDAPSACCMHMQYTNTIQAYTANENDVFLIVPAFYAHKPNQYCGVAPCIVSAQQILV